MNEVVKTLGLVLCMIILILCFNLLNEKTNINKQSIIQIETTLHNRIDSLENELNTFYKNKKDTIIINVVPADVKIYPKIYHN